MGDELFVVEGRTDEQRDRQTDRHEKLIVAFCSFAKAPKNQQLAHKKRAKHDILSYIFGQSTTIIRG